MTGPVYILSALYLTLLVSLVISVLEPEWRNKLWKNTLRRWGKFLGGLAILGVIVQILTLLA
ncbi:MAG: hypothetical protein RLY93_17945 [Sumerlaeia bacterium]